MAEKMVKFCNDIRIQMFHHQSSELLLRFPIFKNWTPRDFILLEKIASLIIAALKNFQLNIDQKIMFENLILKIIQSIPPLYHFEEKKYLMLLKNNDTELKNRLKQQLKTSSQLPSAFKEIKLLSATSNALLLLTTDEILKFLQTLDAVEQFKQFCILNK